MGGKAGPGKKLVSKTLRLRRQPKLICAVPVEPVTISLDIRIEARPSSPELDVRGGGGYGRATPSLFTQSHQSCPRNKGLDVEQLCPAPLGRGEGRVGRVLFPKTPEAGGLGGSSSLFTQCLVFVARACLVPAAHVKFA